jgi:hypothetical protein
MEIFRGKKVSLNNGRRGVVKLFIRKDSQPYLRQAQLAQQQFVLKIFNYNWQITVNIQPGTSLTSLKASKH